MRTMTGQLATGTRAFGSAKLPTLRKMCEQRDLDNRGTRNTLIARLVRGMELVERDDSDDEESDGLEDLSRVGGFVGEFVQR